MFPVSCGDTAVISAGEDPLRVDWIGHNVAIFVSAHRGSPVHELDVAEFPSAAHFDGAAILLRAVDAVWKIVVCGYVIDLRRRLVVPRAPGSARIQAHTRALIGAKDHLAALAA